MDQVYQNFCVRFQQYEAPFSKSFLRHLTLFLSPEAKFGRRLYSHGQLIPFVEPIFQHLRRCHHNRVRKDYKDALANISDPNQLNAIGRKWEDEGYSSHALRLLSQRGDELGNQLLTAALHTVHSV
jgi:hypothetical protein